VGAWKHWSLGQLLASILNAMIQGMQLLWRSLIFGVICTLLLTELLLGAASKASSGAFVLLSPGVWLTSTILGPVIPSDSDGVNFIARVLASSVLNICLYTLVFLLFSKIPPLVRRP